MQELKWLDLGEGIRKDSNSQKHPTFQNPQMAEICIHRPTLVVVQSDGEIRLTPIKCKLSRAQSSFRRWRTNDHFLATVENQTAAEQTSDSGTPASLSITSGLSDASNATTKENRIVELFEASKDGLKLLIQEVERVGDARSARAGLGGSSRRGGAGQQTLRVRSPDDLMFESIPNHNHVPTAVKHDPNPR